MIAIAKVRINWLEFASLVLNMRVAQKMQSPRRHEFEQEVDSFLADICCTGESQIRKDEKTT